MSVIDQFSGKRKQKVEPGLDMPAAPAVAPRALHPAAQEAAVAYSEAIDLAERLRLENAQLLAAHSMQVSALRADLEVERRHVAELQHMLDVEREAKEQYMRYAVEVRTHLGHVAAAAIKANDVAMSMATKKQAEEEVGKIAMAAIEEEVREELGKVEG